MPECMRDKIIWRSYRRVPVVKLPYNQRSWVLDRGSLTKRLIQASEGNFRVEIRRQSWEIPGLDEQRLLNLPSGQLALIREVSLICKGVEWVKARSIIPLRTLTGAESQLAHLGVRPLGAFLFKSKTMRRGPLQIASSKHKKNKEVSARRSIFFLHNKPILVSEYFMPPVFSVATNKIML